MGAGDVRPLRDGAAADAKTMARFDGAAMVMGELLVDDSTDSDIWDSLVPSSSAGLSVPSRICGEAFLVPYYRPDVSIQTDDRGMPAGSRTKQYLSSSS